jgi:hypothetical protein
MTIIIYLRDLIVSLLSNLGLSTGLTVQLADVSLLAIAIGLLIAIPEAVVITAIVFLALAAIKR